MKLIFAVILLLIPGCSILRPEPQIITKVVSPTINHPEFPRPVALENPYFYVVSPANFEEFQERISVENDGVFIALTPGDYEILSANLQELRRYILETQQVVFYYRTVLGAEQQNSETP